MKTQFRIIEWTALAALLTLNLQHATVFAQATAFTYQGRVLDNGTNFTGPGQFKFALVTSTNTSRQATATANAPSAGHITGYTVTDGGSGYLTAPTVDVTGGGGSGAAATAFVSDGTVIAVSVSNPGSGYTSAPTVTIAAPPANITYITFWSNDGTSVNGSQPAAFVTIPVTNGLFCATVGDTALVNMAAIDSSLFFHPNLQLQIWFNDGANGFSQLHPAQNLTATPYATVSVFANTASNLSGTLPASQLSGAVANAGTATNFSGSLSGDVTGTQGATVVSTVGGQTAANVAAGANAANAATSTNTANAIVKRDASGNFWAGIIRASLSGNAATATTATNVVSGIAITNAFITNSVFAGDGRGLTNLNAAQLSGIIPVGQMPTNVLLNGNGLTIQQNSSGAPNVIGGAPVNFVRSGVVGATISGGGATNRDGFYYTNSVSGDFGTIGGGFANTIQAYDATIGGGHLNTIRIGAEHAVIGGGYMNTIQTNAFGSTIGGGLQNTIQTNNLYVTIGGGLNNTIQTYNNDSTIGGGTGNTIQTNAFGSTIGGGYGNTIQANAVCATVPGGYYNVAGGQYSFAAGQAANAMHTGAFVWSDDSAVVAFSSTNANSFSIRAAGGVQICTSSSGRNGPGLYVAPGGNSWTSISDRNAKKDFAPVDTQAVLDKLARVPIEQWHYKWESAGDTLNLGPMAQDFKAAFYPGRDGQGISTLEFDGVELAAIQGLHQKLKEKDVEIQELKQSVAELKAMVERLAGN